MERSRNLSREAWESPAFKRGEDVNPDTDIANSWAIACSIFKSDPVHREQVDQSIASN
jgi:hypothetical protein